MNTAAKAATLVPSQDQASVDVCSRKIRHLQGLSLRNLCISSPKARNRGKTIDDEALPFAFTSPSKVKALSTGSPLGHSYSSSDLTAVDSLKSLPALKDALHKRDLPSSPSKARPGQNRRRSTLDWVNASTGQKQRHLANAISRHTADVFFSLHCPGIEDPVYVSELVEKTMNPNFGHFHLDNCGAAVTRQDKLTVKMWAKQGTKGGWFLLLEHELSLRSLQYLGPSLEDISTPSTENCLLLHLKDGVYAPYTSSLPERTVTVAAETKLDSKALPIARPMSSLDALIRLATLDEQIQEALITRGKLARDINQLMTRDKYVPVAQDQIKSAEDELSRIREYNDTEKQQIKLLQHRLQETRTRLQTRKSAIAKSNVLHAEAQERATSLRAQLTAATQTQTRCLSDIHNQRRRIVEDLSHVYRIDPIPNHPLTFTIRSLPLPNSDSHSDSASSASSDTTSAALGHVAHAVHLLSYYLATPLPYPITAHASISTIADPISATLPPDRASRTFPLHRRGAPVFRFEYAVFLLNKDIEALAARLGLRILDIRQTLANLTYVLFVASAGSGELPARKAGGVRGLLRDRGKEKEKEKPGTQGWPADGGDGDGTPASSRRSSDATASSGGSAVQMPRRQQLDRSHNNHNLGGAKRHPLLGG